MNYLAVHEKVIEASVGKSGGRCPSYKRLPNWVIVQKTILIGLFVLLSISARAYVLFGYHKRFIAGIFKEVVIRETQCPATGRESPNNAYMCGYDPAESLEKLMPTWDKVSRERANKEGIDLAPLSPWLSLEAGYVRRYRYAEKYILEVYCIKAGVLIVKISGLDKP